MRIYVREPINGFTNLYVVNFSFIGFLSITHKDIIN